MSAISSTSYVLPPPRPWDPDQLSLSLSSGSNSPQAPPDSENISDDVWVEGRVVKCHPNICPLLDFFEDSHYYYLILPSTTPDPGPDGLPGPSDLFDLVENYPQGLPASLVRSYLGQIADALSFLHSRGIGEPDYVLVHATF
jgi:protein-serine/threonine kinase